MIVTSATVLTRYRANGAAFHASTKLSSVSGAVGTKRAEYSRGWKAVHTAYASGSSHSAPSSQAARVSKRRPGGIDTGWLTGSGHGDRAARTARARTRPGSPAAPWS